MSIEIETSTDTPEEVKAALGETVEIDESPSEEGEPAAEEDPAEGDGTEEEPGAEEGKEGTEEEPSGEEGEEEQEEEGGKKKPAPQMVPRSRLSKEIARRKAAEAERDAALAGEEPEPEAEPAPAPVAPGRPKVFTDKPEPVLADFMKGVDKFDEDAVAQARAKFDKAVREWDREDARAEAAYDQHQADLQAAHEEKVGGFLERRDAFAETDPEYNKIVPNSKVMLSNFQRDFIFESVAGPQLLLYLVKHPKEAASIGRMYTRSASAAMVRLEQKLVEHYGIETDETEGEPELRTPAPKIPKKPAAPPAAPTSKAPTPPARIKPVGPPARSEREMAGPEDRTGIDIEFNADLEKRDKAKKKA